ncbi:MAG: hypothetical protein H0W50_04120 [Parachlamydiaceae bacterium]|nr:hypothetical protein [Parachlamydiaceae bacterium]
MCKRAQNNENCEDTLLKLARTYSKDSRNLKSLQKLKFGKETVEHCLVSSFVEKASVISKWNNLKLNDELLTLDRFFKLDQAASTVTEPNIPVDNLEGVVDVHQHKKPHFFDDVQFLVKTNLIYSIIGLQNSTGSGSVDHVIKQDETGLLIKKEGEWIPVKKLREALTWNSEEGELESREKSTERWNYFKDGLVPIDRYYHHINADKENFPQQNVKLQPVLKLSDDEMSALLTRARQYNGLTLDNSQDPQKQNCVIQLITNPHSLKYEGMKGNLNAQWGVHVGIRMIFPDGTVYSTGFGLPHAEDSTKGGGNMHFLQTFNGQPMTMDHVELRPHCGRITTNIPVKEDRANAILDQLNKYRASSLRFNLLKQNCAQLGCHVLEAVTGIKLNIQVPLSTWIHRALPDIKNVPVIGKFLEWSQRKITAIKASIAGVIPQVVKAIFTFIGNIVFFVPKKMGVLLRNLLVWSLGGSMGTNPTKTKESKSENTNIKPEDDLGSLSHMNSFQVLLKSWTDENASKIQHSSLFIKWQLEQNSTDVHEYKGQPNMHILPPDSDSANLYSETRKEEFKKLFAA